MAINFVQGQVAVGDPTPGGPNATSNDKVTHAKTVKLTSANFSTGNVDTLVAVLPADASILSMRLYSKTQLAGGGITAATVAIGSASGGSQYATGQNAFGVSGTYAWVTPVQGIVQNYQVPLGADLQIWVRGTATTGNPTSGEVYLQIEYVR